MPKTDNSDKWIIVSIFVQPANLKTNLIFGAAWGEAENQDKVDKWINARDLMLPGRGGKRDKMDKWINARDFMLPGRGGKRDKTDKWIKQAITRSLLLSASYPRLSTIYPVDNLESTS